MKNEDKIIPIEIKSGTNLQSKNLKVYIKKFNPANALRVPITNYKI